MHNATRRYRGWPLAALILLLVGCNEPVDTTPLVIPPTPGEMKLREARGLYGDGQLEETVALLSDSPEIWQDTVEVQVEALKLMAFANCSERRNKQCAADFERLFALDPGFELSGAEAGNPKWDPTYQRARKAAQAK